MLQPNTNVSESIDSSERLLKPVQDEFIFLRDELKNKATEVK